MKHRGLYFKWRTYRRIDIVEDHIQPSEASAHGGCEGGSHCHTNGKQDDGRNVAQERGTHANEEVIKQISLLAGLDPLWKT